MRMAETTEARPVTSSRAAWAGDVWGGLASSLVALPASIAFGVAIFAPLGLGAGVGALAGLLGATALGTIAPLLGGTPRLVSAPCAPAVAVMSAFAVEMVSRQHAEPARVMVLLTLVGLLAAAIQVGLGLMKAGTIIKYIPYPVVTGYLSGVGIVILLKQLPALFGLATGTSLFHGMSTPSLWQWPSLVVGGATIAAMTLGPRLTRAVPAAVLGLLGGAAAYGLIAAFRPELRQLAGNPFVIGPIGGQGPSFSSAFGARLASIGALHWADLSHVVGPATTLAVVLSLDTLKTCVLVDAMTGSIHESNRELLGQGIANAASSLVGGMPGSGTSGPTLVNLASGGQTRWSAVLEGVAVLVAYLALGSVVAWAPLAALAGILAVVAFRMFDWAAMRWVTHPSMAFDFAVVIVVIAVAVGVDLISASAVGVAFSILIFIRNESRSAIIRRKLPGDRVFSKSRRLPAHMDLLAQHGQETVVIELQGSLFFGTTDQLRTQLQEELAARRTIIFDLRRVDALDLTAAHILSQMMGQLAKRGASAVFCNPPRFLAGQQDVPAYLAEIGLVRPDDAEALFPSLSDALAWAEDRLLTEHGALGADDDGPLALLEMGMFAGRKKETTEDLLHCVEQRSVRAGEAVFHKGDEGDEIFFIRAGRVRISLPLDGKRLHLASFGRGDFFGEIVFLDGGRRTADALAECDAELYVISRQRFDTLAAAHPRLGQAIFAGLARVLALRLRVTDGEISALEEA
jgi:SulP family sulfate permease